MRPRFERGKPDELETLHPACFALVMATGIVGIATDLHDVPLLPAALCWLNAVFFAALAVALMVRVVWYPAACLADLRSHSRGVGFFTLPAATSVFGSQLLQQMHWVGLAVVFWGMAVLFLITVTYGVLTVLTVRPDKPRLAEGINGGWLVCVVAPQSVSILTVLLLASGAFAAYRQPLMFAAMGLWLSGGVLYLWLMTVIFFRYTFIRVSVDDLTPPYWISMGAVAISTLAGITLIEHATMSPLVMELAPFIKGASLLFWAIGTWLIPMLVLLGIWRYLIRALPFSYDPLYWGGVFPLGMYGVCTYHLAHAMNLNFLMPVSSVFMLVAVAAWAVAFIGLADSRLYRSARAFPGSTS